MILPGLPSSFCWILTILVHELLIIGALSIDRECVETFTVEPDLHCSLGEPREYYVLIQEPDWMGRWPMNCDHQALRRLCDKWPNEVLADTRCGVCSWPWWVIRASLQD